MLTARQLMTRAPIALRASAKVRDAVQILQTIEIRHLPVVNDQDELVGMLSDRDLRGLTFPYVVDDEWIGRIRSALDAPVAAVMTGGVLAVDEEADAAEIIDLMLDNKIGAVPVLDADGVLVGIVSYVDVLREFPLEAAQAAQ
jgi:acetoin utilization protein AcuB